MNKTDQWINIALALTILLYLSVWASGYFTNKRLLFILLVNMATGLSIIIYWAVRQWQISQHITELREAAVLIFEVIVAGCAVYGLITHQRSHLLKTAQSVFFEIHLSALVLFLIFMLTFKITRLI